MYKDKKILITGGTGTIGYHLTKALLQYEPAVIRIFSRDEHKQYEMSQDFQAYGKKMRYLIGDVRDEPRLLRALEGIDYVFHLAAMKHVPACEYNPFEAVKTNVLGTQNVIQASIEAGVKKVLFTSSDKAISPTNTYGATKLMGERLISATEHQKGAKTTVFSSVRFGNVMGSRGSVIPLFKKQIKESGYMTLTDPDMLRYMMTPSQAIQLILKANEMARGGEVFVLKMPVVRLGDLADVMGSILKSESYNNEIAVNIIGLRPGEKMYEELMTLDEQKNAYETDHMYIIPSIFRGNDKNIAGQRLSLPSNHEVLLPTDPISPETLKNWIISENLV
jgi:UDP-N-acetylglucosamine 4,6-dehydratase/5-epimerase